MTRRRGEDGALHRGRACPPSLLCEPNPHTANTFCSAPAGNRFSPVFSCVQPPPRRDGGQDAGEGVVAAQDKGEAAVPGKEGKRREGESGVPRATRSTSKGRAGRGRTPHRRARGTSKHTHKQRRGKGTRGAAANLFQSRRDCAWAGCVVNSAATGGERKRKD